MQTTRIGGLYDIEFAYPELIVLLENLKMPLRSLLCVLGKKQVRIGLYKKRYDQPGISQIGPYKDQAWLESCQTNSNHMIEITYRIPKADWLGNDLIDVYHLGPEDPTQFKLRDLTEEQKNALLAILRFNKGEVQKNDCVSQEMIAVSS